jgi:positive phototaxis protein PixI
VVSSSSSQFNPSVLFPVAHTESTVTEQCLRFHLVPETTGLLPVSQLSEVLKVNTRQIVPIPKLPSFVMGVYNWRGEMLWVVDLGNLVGLTPLAEQSLVSPTLPLLILRGTDQDGNRQILGLIVNRVESLIRINPDQIQSPPESTFTAELARVLRGYWLTSAGEMLMVLSGAAIFNQMPQPS